MPLEDESSFFTLGEGCPIHGDEHMRECSMCGTEFCSRCFRKSAVCPDCADEASEDDLDEDPDFEDVTDLKEILPDDTEVDRILEDDDEIPDEDRPEEDEDR